MSDNITTQIALAPSYHRNEDSLLVSVDCVIFGFLGEELHVLLHRFPYEPLIGHWALLGGFVKPNTDADEAAHQTVRRLTGLDDIYMEQVHTFAHANRVPSERVITICYYALIEVTHTLNQLSENYGATWQPISSIKSLDMVYDHPQMLDKALDQLRRKVRYQPIGFELLPDKFTMTELQNLYESVLGHKLDKRNFIKKFSKMNLLQKHKDKQKGTSRRGAFFYSFDSARYQALIENGGFFEF